MPTEDAPQACLRGASSVGIHWTNVQHRGCAKHRRDGCSSVDRRKDERPTSRLCEAQTRWLFERKRKGKHRRCSAGLPEGSILRRHSLDERPTSRLCVAQARWLFERRHSLDERPTSRLCGDKKETSRWREEEVLPLFPDFPEREREQSCGSS